MIQNTVTNDAQLNAETLLNLGFVDVASLQASESGIGYRLDGPQAGANAIRLEETNALYAFVRGEEVLYIGKTAATPITSKVSSTPASSAAATSGNTASPSRCCSTTATRRFSRRSTERRTATARSGS